VAADLMVLPRGCGSRRRGVIVLVTGLAGLFSRFIYLVVQPIRLVRALLLYLVTLVLALMILAIHLVLIVLAIRFLSRAGHVAPDLRCNPTRLGGRLRGEQDRQSEQYDACEQLANHGDTSVNDWGRTSAA